MKLHANARTCPKPRLVMVRRFSDGRSREILAAEFAVSTRTVSTWVARDRVEGEAGLMDRCSTPERVRRTDRDRALGKRGRASRSGRERRSLLTGWAYGAIYGSGRERTAALDGWLYTYNHRRRHQAIGRQPPIQRLNNLLGSYT